MCNLDSHTYIIYVFENNYRTLKDFKSNPKKLLMILEFDFAVVEIHYINLFFKNIHRLIMIIACILYFDILVTTKFIQ